MRNSWCQFWATRWVLATSWWSTCQLPSLPVHLTVLFALLIFFQVPTNTVVRTAHFFFLHRLFRVQSHHESLNLGEYPCNLRLSGPISDQIFVLVSFLITSSNWVWFPSRVALNNRDMGESTRWVGNGRSVWPGDTVQVCECHIKGQLLEAVPWKAGCRVAAEANAWSTCQRLEVSAHDKCALPLEPHCEVQIVLATWSAFKWAPLVFFSLSFPFLKDTIVYLSIWNRSSQ